MILCLNNKYTELTFVKKNGKYVFGSRILQNPMYFTILTLGLSVQ